MKFLVTLLLICLGATAAANANPVFSKLAEVNKCWTTQPDVNLQDLPAYSNMSETQWIKLHLSLVEQKLRERNDQNLSASQIKNRLAALDHLHEYWMAGRFPQNEKYSYRTPIFIDDHNTFCAVGYLVKTSGHEDVSRMISQKTNLAYVMDMNYAELDSWAIENGFTKAELAWIQPSYPPGETAAKVGDGVDGVVYEMLSDDADGKLYVGGSFTNVDGSIQANNIAYVTEENEVYTWHSMAGGVNGPVYAMVQFDGKLYVAGHFSEAGGQPVENIAYWDGTSWHAMNCTYGTIHDLIVYKNELYIAGDFDICAALSDVNVARWNGTYWQQMPGLNGRVNTMAVLGDDLLLGGAFTYGADTMNIVRWNADDYYSAFENSIGEEVMDFEWYGDTLFAALKHTTPAQLNVNLVKLTGNTWLVHNLPFLSFSSSDGAVSFNKLMTDGDRMLIGGNFIYNPMMGIYGEHIVSMAGGNIGGSWFLLDSTVNAMVHFKGSVFVGGAFKKDGTLGSTILNGIARSTTVDPPTGIPDISKNNRVSIFPNPVEGNTLVIENNFGADQLNITDMSGRHLSSISLKNNVAKQQVTLPEIARGMYFLNISNDKGEHVVKKVATK